MRYKEIKSSTNTIEREKNNFLYVAKNIILCSLQVRAHTLGRQNSHWSEDIQGNKEDSSFLQEIKGSHQGIKLRNLQRYIS